MFHHIYSGHGEKAGWALNETDIIDIQIVRGIKFGEYRCDKNEDLASLVAQQYYIEHGHEFSRVS